MWIVDFFKKLFKKDSLRDKCIAAYGEEFGKLYDSLNSGVPIGGFAQTAVVLDMIEAVKKGRPYVPEKPKIEVTGVYIPGEGTYEKDDKGNMVLVKHSNS